MRAMYHVAPPTVGARGDSDYGMMEGYGIQGGYGFGVGGPNGNGNGGFMGWLKGINPVLIVVGGILIGYWMRGWGQGGKNRSYRYGASAGARRVKKGRKKRRRNGKRRASTTGARRKKTAGRRKKVRRKKSSNGRRRRRR